MEYITKVKSKKPKVLILSCGTGGGHNTAAKAIQEELISKKIDADFIEYLDIVNPKIKDKINNLYVKSTVGKGRIFKNVYGLGKIYQKTNFKSPVYLLNSFSKKKLYDYIKNNDYKYVITTHLFASEALTAIKKEHDIHFMQIATDYVSIPFWEETDPDYFIIPSDELEEDFTKKNINREILKPYGIPVKKEFREKYNKNAYKKILNLDENKKYILILNGSMGFGNVIELVKKLEKELKDVNFIVSCGNNKNLLKKLEKDYSKDKKVISLPYTENLSMYMKGSDIVLSKPGGLTSTEVATLRKPFIHIMPIPGCENYNADFFNSRKMSIKCDNIADVVENTKSLLEDENLQNEIIENQEKYIKYDVCEKISNIIIEELNKGESYGEDCQRK